MKKKSMLEETYPELYGFCKTAWFLARITKEDFESCKDSATFAAAIAIELDREDLVPV